MKTTKLINGKTFDEVFAERGEKITIDKMVIGDVYLLGKTYSDDWDILHKHDYIEDAKMYGSWLLFDNGSTYYDGFVNCDDVNGIYCATPNQIELLNSYINHNN